MQSLTELDYQWISEERNKLKDEQMDYFVYLMQQEHGLPFQESWKVQLPDFIYLLDPNKCHIQLLHSRDGAYDILQNLNDHSDHWVCCYYDTDTFYILDSMWSDNKPIHPKWLIFLKKLYPSYPFDNKKIVFVPVQRQLNGSDCGVFAIAYATCILNGIWPDRTHIQFDISKTRPHLITILKNKKITPFPFSLQPNAFDGCMNLTHSKCNEDSKLKNSKSINGTRTAVQCNLVLSLSNKQDELNNQMRKSDNEYISVSSESLTSEQAPNPIRNLSRQHFLLNDIRQGSRLHDVHMVEFNRIVERLTDYKPRDKMEWNLNFIFKF